MRYFLFLFVVFPSFFAFADLRDDMMPWWNGIGGIMEEESWMWMIDTLLEFTRDSIFSLLALIAIGMFIFIGSKLIVARGNQEEFKKAMMMFLYTIIGLFIVGASFVAVRLIASLSL